MIQEEFGKDFQIWNLIGSRLIFNMIFKRYLILCLNILFLVNLLFSAEADSAITYHFELPVNSEKYVIYNKTLQWLKKINQQNSIQLIGKTKIEGKITGNGQIFINRYKTYQRVPAKFSFKIECLNQSLLITYSDINIYQHDMIFSDYMKNFELKELQEIFNLLNEDLVEFIIKEEEGFLEWFNWWRKDYFFTD